MNLLVKPALKGLSLECNQGFFRHVYNIFWLLFVRHIPAKIGRWLFEHTSNHSASLKKYAKTYYALELMYETRPIDQRSLQERFWTWFWEQSLWNARAVRNRLWIVCTLLKIHVEQCVNKRESANIVSIASGSARAVIEVLSQLQDVRVKALMTDMSRNALDYSRNLANSFGVCRQMAWQRTLAHQFHKNLDGFVPDIVEMVGLLDYYKEADAEALLHTIYEVLPVGGMLITANVLPNPEMRWPEEMADWKMIYKTIPQFQTLAQGAGFEQVEVFVEPIGIHAVFVCYKQEKQGNSVAKQALLSHPSTLLFKG